MRDDLQAAATEVKNSEVFRCSRYGARNNTTQAAPMPSVKHLHLIREIVVSMMVPGVGVEPTQARGPRDFKAPGRGSPTRLQADLSRNVHLPSFSFFTKRGFETLATVDDYPARGHRNLLLRERLGEASSPYPDSSRTEKTGDRVAIASQRAFLPHFHFSQRECS